MPKVLRIVNRFNLGGPTYNVAYLTKHLSKDFQTILVGGDKEESESSSMHILNDIGVRPIIIPEMKRSIGNNDVVAYYKLKSIIKRFKPDIVHTHASKAGVLGRLAAHNCGVPAIFHTFHGHVFHSYFNKPKTEFFKMVERKMASYSSKIITISNIQKHEIGNIHQICDPNKIEVVPLGFDLSRFHHNQDEKRTEFRAKYNLDDDEIAIGIIGRLTAIKNHKLFIHAIQHMNAQAKVRAFIIGDGELKQELMDFCKSINVEFTTEAHEKKPITFTSWIKNVDVAYAGLDVVALTSLNEGTPVTLIEAQAAGKPIVSTNVGGIEDVIIPNETALLSPTNNVELLSENFSKIVASPELRNQLAQKGWEHVHQKFNYMRMVNDIENIYRKTLSLD